MKTRPQQMRIAEMARAAKDFERELEAQKAAIGTSSFGWYPYGSLDNFHLLSRLLGSEYPDLLERLAPGPVVDIGAADGDTAFFLESQGFEVDVVDYGPTNYNGCRGARALIDARGSSVRLSETDLDSQFVLPRERYALAVFLGILYHLKNPYFVLERLAAHADHLLLSTRVARFNKAGDAAAIRGLNRRRVDLESVPVAYLVAPDETHNDPTNYWIFTIAGLSRILDRTGWEIRALETFGASGNSDPASAEGDERAFVYAVRKGAGAG